MNRFDKAAIAAAAHALAAFVDRQDQLTIAGLLTEHLQNRYAAAGAFKAARDGLDLIAAGNLSETVRQNISNSRKHIDRTEAAKELAELAA